MGGIFNCALLEARSLPVGVGIAEGVSATCAAVALVHRSEAAAANDQLAVAERTLGYLREPLEQLILRIPEQAVSIDETSDLLFQFLHVHSPRDLREAWQIGADQVEQLARLLADRRFDLDPSANWTFSNELSLSCSQVLAIGSMVTVLDRASGDLTA